MGSAIETFNLSKTYGATKALVDLDMRVEEGECFGYLGPNGAGKTTTIRLLLALQRPTSGHAEVLGRECQRESVEIHRRIGYLPGDLALYPKMTGQHLIDFFAKARGEHDPALARDLVERFGVVLDRPAKELSTGNRQKIGLVLAFMHRPELLVLDEPTSALDPLMQDEFERLVQETVADGRTVFLSSHELDEVQRLAGRVSIIRSGTLVTTDTVAGLRKSAPQRIEARFPRAVDVLLFTQIDGVTVKACDEGHLSLEVSGPIGPVLKVIAEHDPLEVVSRHADLDELFLDFYRDRSQQGAVHAS
jgi:ABC-2 type transport system ATP-binding protein